MENSLSFSEDKTVGEFKVELTRKISEAHVEEIIVNWYEMCDSSWCFVPRNAPWREDLPEGEAPSMWAVKKLLDGESIILVEDTGEIGNGRQDLVWCLTLEKLLMGIQKFLEAGGDLENMDMYSYDSIIQYAVMGEVAYS